VFGTAVSVCASAAVVVTVLVVVLVTLNAAAVWLVLDVLQLRPKLQSSDTNTSSLHEAGL